MVLEMGGRGELFCFGWSVVEKGGGVGGLGEPQRHKNHCKIDGILLICVVWESAWGWGMCGNRIIAKSKEFYGFVWFGKVGGRGRRWHQNHCK